MDFDTQPAITVIATFVLEPVARLEQVLCEVAELCWSHRAGLSDVDAVDTLIGRVPDDVDKKSCSISPFGVGNFLRACQYR